ncbi:MAG: hypothetical protein KDA83_09600, partial [Planctomycetales bacterium]|nr:hypothetical protein [Planctomycetales bacterium]
MSQGLNIQVKQKSQWPRLRRQVIEKHRDRTDRDKNRIVVRDGFLPQREITTGAGQLAVRQPRVRDSSDSADQRVAFTPRSFRP